LSRTVVRVRQKRIAIDQLVIATEQGLARQNFQPLPREAAEAVHVLNDAFEGVGDTGHAGPGAVGIYAAASFWKEKAF